MNKNNEDIFKLLNLPYDETLQIDYIEVNGYCKEIHISRPPLPTFCDNCGARMHSKGIISRTLNHQILQDTTTLLIKLSQRRWCCSNPHCKITKNESFAFAEKHKQSTSLIPFLVLQAMKDLNRSTSSIAKQFNISNTHVHNIFTSYVDFDRLPLPEYLCVDEVYLNINHKDKYALVLMDFITGEIIDIVHNRWQSTANHYFYSIPLEEMLNVKYIICDAYKAYMEYPSMYFPNAIVIFDSFHVTKYLISKLNSYMNQVCKRYKEKDKAALEKKNHDTNRDNKSIKASKEVILLTHYKWILLKNKNEINDSDKRYYHNLLGMYLDTYTIEKMFFDLDKNLKTLHSLKEKFIIFNQTKFNTQEDVKQELQALIKLYKASDQHIFREFADYLNKYQKEIIQSFITVEVSRRTYDEQNKFYSRLSNGPMEGFNRKPKDYKRNDRTFL